MPYATTPDNVKLYTRKWGVTLEEPDLFNQVVGVFLSRVDGRSWLPRDPRTRPPKPPAA
jgi:hypothetical protein